MQGPGAFPWRSGSCNSGYTIAELLVVIGALGTAALLVNGSLTGQAVARSRLGVQASNLRSIQAEVERFQGCTGRYPVDLSEICRQGARDLPGADYVPRWDSLPVNPWGTWGLDRTTGRVYPIDSRASPPSGAQVGYRPESSGKLSRQRPQAMVLLACLLDIFGKLSASLVLKVLRSAFTVAASLTGRSTAWSELNRAAWFDILEGRVSTLAHLRHLVESSPVSPIRFRLLTDALLACLIREMSNEARWHRERLREQNKPVAERRFYKIKRDYDRSLKEPSQNATGLAETVLRVVVAVLAVASGALVLHGCHVWRSPLTDPHAAGPLASAVLVLARQVRKRA